MCCYERRPSKGKLLLFISFLLLQPLTVLMKQTRQAVRAIKQSIFFDVYEPTYLTVNIGCYLDTEEHHGVFTHQLQDVGQGQVGYVDVILLRVEHEHEAFHGGNLVAMLSNFFHCLW
jgi:hypothetical protein